LNLLVIGGTYFLGRAFVELAHEKHDIVALNRGTRDMGIEGVRCIKADRHLLEDVDFSGYSFDAVVDFCGYESKDIKEIVEALIDKSGIKIKRYIFVSTVDVYKRGLGTAIDENAEFEDRVFPGPAGQYISGKVALEKELKEVASKYNITVNSIRPAFIYGPGNYSGREDMFINWVNSAGQVLYPVDSDGSFYMVYVGDVAKAVLKVLENQCYESRNYNICASEIVTYDTFVDALSYAMKRNIERVEISVSDINERGIPLPYPLTREESEQYVTLYGEELNIDYISLKEGLKTICL